MPVTRVPVNVVLDVRQNFGKAIVVDVGREDEDLQTLFFTTGDHILMGYHVVALRTHPSGLDKRARNLVPELGCFLNRCLSSRGVHCVERATM